MELRAAASLLFIPLALAASLEDHGREGHPGPGRKGHDREQERSSATFVAAERSLMLLQVCVAEPWRRRPSRSPSSRHL